MNCQPDLPSRLISLSVLALVLVAIAFPVTAQNPSEQVTGFSGAFSQVIPIEVPPFRGLEPRLALAYSSQARNGFVGVGWALAGFSLVERVSPGRGSPRFDATDTYVLDGQDLIACQTGSVSPSCTTGGTHSTKIESYLRIAFNSTANTWTVWGKDGTKTVLSAIYQVPSGTLRWGQTSRVDTHGNTVSYAWICQGGDCYPSSVQFGPYSVTLYSETRPDVLTAASASANAMLQTLYRLRSVLVAFQGSPIRAYRLTYTVSPVTGQSLLASAQQYGKDVVIDASGSISGGTSLPAETFAYQNDTIAMNFQRWPSPGTTSVDDAAPTLNAQDVSVTKPHRGTASVPVTLTLSQAASVPITVSYSTVDGTATVANLDYFAASDSVTFPAGATAESVTLYIWGDTRIQTDKYFTLRLASGSDVRIARAQVKVTILNDNYPAPGNGTGADGSLTVGNGQTVYTDGIRAALSSAAAAGATSINVSSTTGFAVGQEVLVIQMTGLGAGNYESGVIASVGTGVLNLSAGLGKAYSADTSSKAQVIRIPNYSSVTVQNGGTLTVSAWNGSTGGVMFYRATGAVNVQTGGVMTVAALGFAGATGGPAGSVISNGGAPGGGGPGHALSDYCWYSDIGSPGWCDDCTHGPCQNVSGLAGSSATNGTGAPVAGGVFQRSCNAYGCFGGNGGGGGVQGSTGTPAQPGTPGGGPGGGSAGLGGINAGSAYLLLMGGGGGGGNGGAQGVGGGGGGGGGGGVIRLAPGFAGGQGASGASGGQGGAGGSGGIAGGLMIVNAASITIAGTASAAGTAGTGATAGTGGGAGGAGGAAGYGDSGGYGNASGAQGQGGRGAAGGDGGVGGGGGAGGTILFRAYGITTTGGTVTVSGGTGGAGASGGAGGAAGTGTSSQGTGPNGATGANGTTGGNGRYVPSAGP